MKPARRAIVTLSSCLAGAFGYRLRGLTMKIAGLLALSVPEVKRLTWGQLLKVWSGCTGWSRDKLYLHLLLLLACCSVIFNLTMRLGGGFLLDLAGLLVGLTVPPNIYFAAVLGSRRPQLRKFIEEHWSELDA